jgi:hypothetical protein
MAAAMTHPSLDRGTRHDPVAAGTIAECLARVLASSGLREPPRVRVTTLSGPGLLRPVVAQANLTLAGEPIRLQTAAAAAEAAATTLAERLERRLAERVIAPLDWPGDRCGTALEASARALGRRELARRKHVVLDAITPQRASFRMDRLDYDFYLFVDQDSGEDSMVRRAGPTGYRLSRVVGASRPRLEARRFKVVADNRSAITESVAAAVATMEEIEMDYRFFRDSATSRGAVVYRRYDGNYGYLGPTA